MEGLFSTKSLVFISVNSLLVLSVAIQNKYLILNVTPVKQNFLLVSEKI